MRELRLPARLSADSLFGRWNGIRHGDVAHLENSRGIPGSDNEHVLGDAVAEGVRHGGGAVQRHPVGSSAGGEHRRDLLHRQRSSLRHLLPHVEGFES